MTWLRASRSVIDPAGTRWDVYITRMRSGVWNAMDAIDDPDPLDVSSTERFFLLIPVMVILELLLGLVKLLALVPLSLAGVALRSPLRVEAISDDADRTTYAWNVERPVLGGVLDAISAGLERGSIVRPTDARYLGRMN